MYILWLIIAVEGCGTSTATTAAAAAATATTIECDIFSFTPIVATSNG